MLGKGESFGGLRPRVGRRRVAGKVAGAPQVPGGDGSARDAALAAPGHDLHVSEHGGIEWPGLSQAGKGEREAFADAVVAEREHVGATKPEHEEHFGCPATDAAHRGETRNDVFVGEATDLREPGDGAVERFAGEVLQREHFVLRQAAGAERFVGLGEQQLGGWMDVAEEAQELVEDGAGGCAVELLREDGLKQRLEGGVLAFEAEGERGRLRR